MLTLENGTVTLKQRAPKDFAFCGKLIQELVQARSIGEKMADSKASARNTRKGYYKT